MEDRKKPGGRSRARHEPTPESKREKVRVSLPTVPLDSHTVGNSLFNRAVFAIGLDGTLVRRELAGLLGVIGVAPRDLTADDLGALLPEIDKRLRLLVSADQADHSMTRLRRMLLTHDDG